MNEFPIPADQLIPHRPPLLLISSLEKVAGDSASAAVRLCPNHIFAYPGGDLDGLVFIEMLAQLTAAYNSASIIKSGTVTPKMGYLVGIKQFTISCSAYTGNDLRLEIKKETQFENVSYISGKVMKNDNTIAEGSLKLWELSGTPPRQVLSQNAKPGNGVEIAEWAARSFLHRKVIGCLHKISAGPDGGSADCFLPEDFIGFQGHFPDYPILPGVFMLKMAVIVSELLLNRPLSVTHIKVAKFARSILPNTRIEIGCTITENDSEITIDSRIQEHGQVCAKIQLVASSKDLTQDC